MWLVKRRCIMRTSARVKVLNRRILKILALFMVTVIPRSALSDANLGHVSRLADTSIRQLVGELDSTPRTLSPLISHSFRLRIRPMNLWSGFARNAHHLEWNHKNAKQTITAMYKQTQITTPLSKFCVVGSSSFCSFALLGSGSR